MTSRRTIDKLSPDSGEPLGQFGICTTDDVRDAVARARAAFPSWRDLGLQARLERLDRIRAVLAREGERYARTISADTGKPLVDALTTELLTAALLLEHYRKLAPRVLARQKVRTPLLFPGKRSYVEYFPMGVIGVIAPWNYPFQLSVLPVLSALIGGNTAVLKPSEVTPLTGELVRELFTAIELPEGVVEVVQGDGETGAALVRGGVDKVLFTGSVATGRRVMAAAAEAPIPVELELGGKDAMIVCADANLERAARGAAWGGLMNCGQTCISVERILVVDQVHDRFVELLERQVRRVRVGGPDDNADMGPLTFAGQLETIRRHVDRAVHDGARVVCGGAPLQRPGQYHQPTLLVNVSPGMEIYREETFGPVLPVVRVQDEDEAVQLANDHQYGLNASVWTADRRRGLALASRLECGQVMVNDVITISGNPALPFGGVKASGFGRYHGPEGLTTFMNQRAIMVGKDHAPGEPLWFPYEHKYDDVLQTFRHVVAGRLLALLGPMRRLSQLGADDTEP